ncbi:MAG TPA: hypothetical protein VHI93_06780, partial [Candidatus Thermoplasmatota archaeon]|nr:hypothetical protein [Candidatus Thermoplasmatota archaeon]
MEGRGGVTRFRPEWALLGILPLVWLVHSLPHLPGPPTPDAAATVPALAERAAGLVAGEGYPYPIHVDEHNHLAAMAQVARTGRIDVPDPYTGRPPEGELFSVAGMRSERGWDLAMVQVHQVTGISLPTLARFLPALWGAYLALAVWACLRPAPGALAAAALTAAIPTTLRFLGPGFLVPSAFALPWLVAVLAVSLRGRGPGRFAALVVLITGAFFVHLVLGTLALAVGLAAALLQPGPLRARVAAAGTVALPLLWLYPAIRADAEAAVASEHSLPFDTGIFLSAGFLLPALAVGGAFWAVHRRIPATAPHRALLVLLLAVVASLAASVQLDHRNDATYSRLVPTFFLCLACLASLALGKVRVLAVRLPFPGRTSAAAGAALAVGALALAPAVQAHLDEPYYRVFDPSSWEAGEALARVAGTNDTFLSHPWRAPVYNALSGARPWAYLLPGAGAVHGEDHAHYVRSGGASAAWLAERNIAYVVDAVPPNATHEWV